MAGGIKGITVKIGGDTTDLGRALSSAQKQSTALQKELRGVNTLLKMDPKNVTLLSQKQEILNKSIEETKNKLNSLKEVMAKVDAGEIEMTEEEYRNLQREIVSTENKLKSLEAEQKKFGSVGAQVVSEYGKKLQDLGGKMETAGKKLMPLSGAIGGLGVMAIKTTADFDMSMSNVSAISGATGESLDQLRDKAREMGAQTKYSASESADAMSYMAMAGWKTEDMLDGISGVMLLASASGEDLAKTSDILTDGLTAFGLSAKDSGRMADVMASASSNANTNVSLLGESYKYCATTAGAMGYSLEDVTESLSLMGNAGVKGSQAGTTLKNAMINMAKPTAQMAGVMDKYGISITNADGSMKTWNEVVDNLRSSLGDLSEAEQTSAVATLFGKEATAGMLSVINAGPEDIEKLNTAINNSTGSSKEMADTMNNNLTGQITILKSQLQELAISFGELLIPVIRSVVTVIQGFVDKLNGMSDAQKTVILVIGGILASLGPLLLTVGKSVGAIGTIMTYAPQIATLATTIGGAIKGLFATLLANPIALVVAGLVALVSAFIYAYNHSERFREVVNNALNAVKTVASNVVKGLVTFFTSTIPNALNSFKTKVTTVLNAIKSVFTNIWNGIKTVTSTVWNGIKSVVSTALNAVKSVVSSVGGGIKSVTSNVFNGAKNVAVKAFNAIKSGITTALNGAKAVVGSIANGIKDKIITPFNNIKSKFLSVGKNVIEGVKSGITGAISGLYKTIKGAMSGLVDKAKNALGIHSPSRVFEKQIGEQIVNGLVKGVDNKKANAKKSAEELSKLYVSSANAKIRQLEKANKITLAQEETFWRQVANKCKKGTTGYKDALANAVKAKTDFNKQLKKLDDDYAKDVKALKDQLTKDIQDITDKYNEAVNARQESITKSLALFEAFKADDGISNEDLTTNLQSQVDALREWDNVLDQLANRSGMDNGLLKELENMGVNSLETLKAINSMSDGELEQYVSLFKEKNKIALERAEIENQALKELSEKEIAELMKKADEDLAKLEAQYVKNLKKLGVTTAEQSKDIGVDIVEGLKTGITSQNASFQRFLSEFFQQIINNAKASLDINSPSRVFRDVVGKQIPAGIAVGIEANADQALDAVSDMTNSLTAKANADIEALNGATINRQLNTTFRGDGAVSTTLTEVMRTIKTYGEKLIDASNKQIVLDSGTLVGETIDKIDSALAGNQMLRARGV